MENKLYVTSSPHLRSEDSVERIMLDVVIALMPALIAGIIIFGIRALFITVLCIVFSIATEAVIQILTHKDVTINDFSAVVTGILLAFNLPVSIPWWIAAIGSIFAIAIVKQVFGGLGHNFMNPALAARAFLLASWPVPMSRFTVDGITSATPLAIIKGTESSCELPSLFNMFIGLRGGTIGEVSIFALLIGAVYLLIRKVITLRIPLSYILTVAVLTWVLGKNGLFTGDPLYHIMAGGLILGAFFMATDYTTSPVTPKGQIIFGIGCGIFTSIIRLYGGYPEGVSYSILLMNIATPIIDKYTAPKVFGEVKINEQ
ncbi:RnfABCDGE type electron transport complex subunit D [Thermoanaerobacterium thermosaccharolyticum]|uniref:RnfABCDGE type electron transport complex subunit D n=1 Tax=Thermoanaerobacterium thermosaccharolyticum TaxID=1517 RepID=UPI00177B4F2B|nr:RnfABCDGE type electron transport complex subunit D [Thermoanaerobacterium thermosaccharolyticum]MBE0068941.1 RnfABCDGE type electron transport complex subunit D [Thermoanaerobacterium thermosaccharolyticum]MBE0228779.1 RnfABCDGE type electron transport complex subunit D [Thermoanaerobacterium thermosaccharolyticum]